jgi:hypothetical protein
VHGRRIADRRLAGRQWHRLSLHIGILLLLLLLLLLRLCLLGWRNGFQLALLLQSIHHSLEQRLAAPPLGGRLLLLLLLLRLLLLWLLSLPFRRLPLLWLLLGGHCRRLLLQLHARLRKGGVACIGSRLQRGLARQGVRVGIVVAGASVKVRGAQHAARLDH